MIIFKNMTLLVVKSASISVARSTIKSIKCTETHMLSPVMSHYIHTSNVHHVRNPREDKSKYLTTHCFDVEDTGKEAFLDILRKYTKYNVNKRGILRFLKVAMDSMEKFGVQRDLEVYKALFDVLPKGPYVPKNRFQFMFFHYQRHHDAGIDLLHKMEHYGVMPDTDMEDQLIAIYGKHSKALKKYWRMMYWMPKFRNLNPWPAIRNGGYSLRELAKMAVWKMASADINTQITEFETSTVKDSIDDTWIISGMSQCQEDLLRELPSDKSLFVEGPFSIWVADNKLDYFVLRTDPWRTEVRKNPDDVHQIQIPFWDDKEIVKPITVHEQKDGVYLALCVTGTSSKDSLLSWIRCLQKKNPRLLTLPIVFKLTSSVVEKPEQIECETQEPVVLVQDK